MPLQAYAACVEAFDVLDDIGASGRGQFVADVQSALPLLEDIYERSGETARNALDVAMPAVAAFDDIDPARLSAATEAIRELDRAVDGLGARCL